MSFGFETKIALLGLLASACNTPEADDTGDEFGSETGDTDTGTETGDTDTGDTSDTGDTGEPIAGCECIVDEEFTGGAVTPSSPTCGADLCPRIEIIEDDVVVNPEAVDCALMALRDRTPGIVTWHYSINIGQTSDTGYILIAEDGRGVDRWWGSDDKSFTISDARLGQLAAASAYDACLAEPEAIMRYYCVRTMLAPVDAVCDEGLTF